MVPGDILSGRYQLLKPIVAFLPLLVVGTYLDVELEVGRPFARTLETLVREQLATRLSLRRLTEGGVQGMLQALSGQPPPSAFTRAVYRETEGNPFFVEEVFHHLSEEGALFGEDGQWRPEVRMSRIEVPEGCGS